MSDQHWSADEVPDEEPESYESWSELRRAVEVNDGLLTTTMETLRETKGAGRLGKHVRDAISKELAANGLGHLPAPLPEYQERPVRVYVLGGRIADVVNAVLNPSMNGDERLREVVSSREQEAIETIGKIRELVCD